MKIAAYVQTQYSKAAYSNECLDRRQFVGLRVIIDSIERAEFGPVEYAGVATIHEYDLILVSITSDCDWWQFIRERLQWRSGKYKVVIGGPGVLNVRPFLEFADFFALGRGEDSIIELLHYMQSGGSLPDGIIEASSFDVNRKYKIRQIEKPYPHSIRLSDNRQYCEGFIGCNHKCLFCGYTWHRKYIGDGEYKMQDSLFGGIEHKERAILDMKKDYSRIDFSKLRTTAIDGFSERLRFAVQKKISKDCLADFFNRLLLASIQGNATPHKLKIYNICGFPSETEEDVLEFIETLSGADEALKVAQKQWWIDLHCTPFRPMPATPAACWPMMPINQRNRVRKILRRGKDLSSGIFYQGNNFFAVEGGFIDSFSTVMLSAIVWRGTENDAINIKKIAASTKFDKLNSADKEATLKHYFDIDALFGAFTWESLPTRYLQTYARIEAVCQK
jgi:hypothetical protein